MRLQPRLSLFRSPARWLLLCWLLSLAAPVASPLFKPQSLQLVCSGAGVSKLLIKDDEGGARSDGLGVDCPLCCSAGAPPPRPPGREAPQPAWTLVSAARAEAALVARSAAPLPARGPPALV